MNRQGALPFVKQVVVTTQLGTEDRMQDGTALANSSEVYYYTLTGLSSLPDLRHHDRKSLF